MHFLIITAILISHAHLKILEHKLYSDIDNNLHAALALISVGHFAVRGMQAITRPTIK